MIGEVMLEPEIELEEEQVTLEEKNSFPKKKLRVYVSEETNKYYIDMAAAFELGLVSYEYWTAREKNLYEITILQLNIFKNMYEVEYKYLKYKNEKEEQTAFDKEENSFTSTKKHAYNEVDNIKSNLDELIGLRNQLVKDSIYNHENTYKDSNEIKNFFSKK